MLVCKVGLTKKEVLKMTNSVLLLIRTQALSGKYNNNTDRWVAWTIKTETLGLASGVI